MSDFCLDKIVAGEPDGKQEALHIKNFDQFFFDYEGMHSKIYQSKYYFVSGRKGSGKTLFAEFIVNDSRHVDDFRCSMESFKNLLLHKEVQSNLGALTPESLYSLWKWVLLLNLGKKLVIDNEIPLVEKRKLNKFFKKNHYFKEIDVKEIVEQTLKRKVVGGLLSQGLEASSEAKKRSASYLNYVESLTKEVVRLIGITKNRYWIIYDELDDKFDDSIAYKKSILALVEATVDVNSAISVRSNVSKVILLLRSDILAVLNSPNVNKAKYGNTLHLDWGTRVTRDSPLLEMLMNRVRKSHTDFSDQDADTIFRKLFPPAVNTIPTAKYLLERTFFRPRDICTYLREISKKYGEEKAISADMITDTEILYSQYLVGEVRNEISGYLDERELDDLILLIKHYRKNYFYFNKIEYFYLANRREYPSIRKLKEGFKALFKANVVGNRWPVQGANYFHYSFCVRVESDTIDFTKELVVHMGLRKALVG